jgi:hypothetical protein
MVVGIANCQANCLLIYFPRQSHKLVFNIFWSNRFSYHEHNAVYASIWSSDYIWLVFLQSVMSIYQISIRVFYCFIYRSWYLFLRKKSRYLIEVPDAFIFG